MAFSWPDWGPEQWTAFIGGAVVGPFLLGLVYLLYLSEGLQRGMQAQILATVLGSFGTLLLAGATFYNVIQTNRNLRLKEKNNEKPLAVDELSNALQPAISALEKNLREYRNSEVDGCAFKWVYVNDLSRYAGSKGPELVTIPYSLAGARLADEDEELFQQLTNHDKRAGAVAEMGLNLHESLSPEIERLLEDYGFEEPGDHLEVVSSSVIREVGSFAETNQLYDFWEQHRDHLIDYARGEVEPPLDELQAREREYAEFVEDALKNAKQRKAMLKQEYSISEDEIAGQEEDELSRYGT